MREHFISMDLATINNFFLARLRGSPKPIILEFELTHQCNLRCVYCDRNTPLPHEMTLEEIYKALDEFYALGMRYIGLDGGEPLLHPHFEEIVAWLYKRNVVIHLNSNGTLIDKKINSVKLVSQLKISIDGPRAVHDEARGKGSFNKAIEGAMSARNEGIPTELRCVLGKHNVDAVDALIDQIEQIDRKMTIMFQPVRNSLFLDSDRDGRAFMAENDDIIRALKRIEQRKVLSKQVANRWGSLAHFRNFPNDTAIPCAAGWIKATMDPEGYLFHCGMVGRNRKEINVVERGAEEAFFALKRYGCLKCWCARAVEGNLAWGGELIKLFRKPR